VLIGLSLFAVLAVGGVAGYSPALRRQITELDAGGAESRGYEAASARARGIGIFLAVVVTAAVFVMVFKPLV
jgi:hypothetical protein